jgi:hypothetical protein
MFMSAWTIAAAELRIPWDSDVAAHRMILVVNPQGEAVRQFNGLASWLDAGAWRHKPIGYLPSDRLRGYDTASHPTTYMPIHGTNGRTRNASTALERGCALPLVSGSEAEIAPRLAAAARAIRALNSLSPGPEGGAGLPYPFLGFGRNSNSFFSTLLAAMDLAEPTFARPALLTPGRGAMLLPQTWIAEISGECRAQCGSASTMGPMKSATGRAIASTPASVG